MLPTAQIAKMLQGAITSVSKNRGLQIAIAMWTGRVLSDPKTQNNIIEVGTSFMETLNEFASICETRINNGEVEARTIVQFVKRTYRIGNVSNSTILQGEHIVNNTTIHIHINVKNYYELERILSEIPDIRRQLNYNAHDLNSLKLFADNTLNPFLEGLEKILSYSIEHDKFKSALNSQVY